MQKITMFTMASCPYCQRARQYMKELCGAHPEYGEIPITLIDEVEQPDLANQYDYYYVPTYYVGQEKVHEGAASKAQVEAVYQKAL